MATQIAQERTGPFAWRGEPMTLLGKPVAAGDRAPDFSVRTLELKPFHLSDALAGETRPHGDDRAQVTQEPNYGDVIAALKSAASL